VRNAFEMEHLALPGRAPGRRPLWLGLGALVATSLLVGGGVLLWLVLRLAFPYGQPLPAPAGPPTGVVASGAERSVVHARLLSQLDQAQVNQPRLAEGAAALKARYRRGLVLPEETQFGSLGPLAFAMPLLLDPESSAEVDHDLRHAVYLAAPGRVAWSVDLPPAARLSAAVACLGLPGTAQAAHVQIRIVSESGQSVVNSLHVAAARPAEVAFESPWQDLEQDLSALAGQRVRVELEAQPVGVPGRQPPSLAHVLVADPVVLGRLPLGAPRPPNLLWINIDTVQAASCGASGGPSGLTPQIDHLAREGVTFLRAYAASNWTRPSNMAFMTGRYPSELGLKVEMIPTLREERSAFYQWGFATLPRHLGRQGYLTQAIVQNNLLEDVWGTGVDVGFRGYRYVSETPDHSHVITAEAVDFVRRNRSDTWFLYLGYNAPHWPYRPTRSALRQTGFANRRPLDYLKALYQAEVAFSDAYLAPLLETLHALGLEQDTLVVVNSDHGEQLSARHAQELVRASLWEPDTASRLKSRPGHETLLEETARVPLVLRWPGHLPAGRVVRTPTAGYDIPPTLLDVMGLPPMPGIRGRSLAPSIFGHPQIPQPVLLEGKSVEALVLPAHKYIRRAAGYEWVRWLARGGPLRRVPEELYDLVADPRELNDLTATRPNLLERARYTMRAIRPRPRFLYTLLVQAPKAPEGSDGSAAAAPLELEISLSPADQVGRALLLGGEPDDHLQRSEDSYRVLLRLPLGDRDRIVFRSASADACVAVKVRPVGPTASTAAADVWREPLRCGRWRLPIETGSLDVCDLGSDGHLDSDRDVADGQPGLQLWRQPVVGGIPGRGGDLDAAVQETFKAWGYVQ